MSLSQKSRTAIYTGLTEFVDEQAVEEMLSFFPSRDLDEPVTKEFLRAEMADLRAEMADLRTEMHGGQAEGRVGLAELCAEMHQGFRRLTMAIYGSMVATAGVVIAAATITG